MSDVARCAAREPLPFLPKAAYAWQQAVRTGRPDRAHAEAEKCWLGGENAGYGEGRDPWVRLALRGHDPFADEDVGALLRFGELALTVFDALAPVEATETVDD